jgi:uncharacterized protein (TIRG00374 family)
MKSEVQRHLRWFIRIGVSTGLIVLLLLLLDRERLVECIGKVNLEWFLLALLIQGVGILAGVIRWDLLLGGQQLHLPLGNLGGAYLVGRFFGSFLPSTIGLDAYRTYYAAVRTREVARCVAVTAVEKVIGLLALSALALAALPLGMRLLPQKALWTLGAILCAPIIAAALLLFYPGLFIRVARLFHRLGRRWTEGIAKWSEAVGQFGAQRGRLLLATALGLVVHGANRALYIATARAVGAGVPSTEILFIGPLMIAATLVPISIAGIGVREGTYVFFLASVGVPTEQAVLLGFLGYLAGEIYSLIGGVVWAVTPAARPGEGHGLVEVVKRAAAWVRGEKQPGEEMQS